MAQLTGIRARPAPEATPVGSASAPRRAPALLVHPGPAEERLIRTLALDRLRDLHDDGVTLDYIGRMYGVGGEQIARIEERLRRLP